MRDPDKKCSHAALSWPSKGVLPKAPEYQSAECLDCNKKIDFVEAFWLLCDRVEELERAMRLVRGPQWRDPDSERGMDTLGWHFDEDDDA